MAGFTSNSVNLGWQPIAIPAVCILISFLGYSSQWLFYAAENLEPGPLTRNELYIFNGLLASKTDSFPFAERKGGEVQCWQEQEKKQQATPASKMVPKVCSSEACQGPSLPTLFFRFLLYTNGTLVYYLSWLIFPRFAALYDNRDLPYYLGPSVPVLIHLTLLMVIGGVTEFALIVMFVTTAKSWIVNTTHIESWEIDRHEALLSRGGIGCSTCPHPNDDASDFEDEHCMERIEFPYDVGFFANMAQGMGSRNPLLWFLPIFGSSIELGTDQSDPGWSWPENEFNEEYGMWPPVDPEKERRSRSRYGPEEDAARLHEFEEAHKDMSNEEIKAAFKARQEADIIRQKANLLAELEEVEDYDIVENDGWANANGEKLADYGVDDESDEPELPPPLVDDGPRVIEIGEDEEDVPLAEILRRRKARAKEDDSE
ncbi:palmitoyltransferase [Zalerion maritima]|uniref:Palmitoyltransferase n=1 Tax=Zalerion maritima TaxID=339359 RepID=A0AAD5RLU3_9PEZI|nr:palmitoyltransferase [Zalerion maritima]